VHHEEESVSKIIDIFRRMQGTMEEHMCHNRRTLQEITEIRKDNVSDEVTYLLFSFP
jgi:hypothetical protein